MITVHHLGVSQSERIIWLCEELALPYELKIYDRDSLTRLAPADYKALHPFGTAPVITDGTRMLAESGAIIDYVIGKYAHGQLSVSPEHPDFANYLFWFHFSNASMMPSLSLGLLMSLTGLDGENAIVQALNGRARTALDMVEARLGQTAYFAGAGFSAADIMMLFPLTTMRYFAPRDMSPFPNTRAYLARIGTRPAYQRAMAKGDPGMMPLLD